MDGAPDISKIIGLIMENPDIIEKIRTLADGSGSNNEVSADTYEKQEKDVTSTESVSKAEEITAVSASESKDILPKSAFKGDKKRRTALLCALKPYLSDERSRAIDTMLSVMEVIDLMKVR
ncbi:MAG: hypothetical protein E7617_06570 [Ruminococcaceae bacterium]|nr:hypothetical protein [Oscillospiraceae bacterium]